MITRPLFFFLSLLLVCAAAGVGAQDSEAELEALRVRMEALRRSLESDEAQRSAVETELRRAEEEIGARTAALRRLQAQRADAQQRVAALRAERAGLETRIGTERSRLADQVRAAYVVGRNERLKLLLNQQDPASLGRMMVYYDYFNRTRRKLIDSVSADLVQLVAVAAEQEREAERLRQVESEREAEINRLEAARERRATVLAKLDQGIRDKGGEIAKMEEQAATLEKLVEELRAALRDFPVEAEEPFDQAKGALAWPLAGRLLKDFGQPRARGRLKWDGVLVGAPRGTEVRAVYHGRVAYADWLTGLGLLVILEHGDGFLTLYGHNDSVFPSVGEWVAPGEAIAEVGNSGGQTQPALYFEIRKGKEPLNPHRWFASRLTSH